MSQPIVIAVAGLAGVGKTTWIQEQLSQATGELFYFCPGAGNVPIDQTQIRPRSDPNFRLSGC
ncbi:MAG: hypothetical protein KME35_03560 [Aphanocapsa sp. GSE-SYN-MK-11-07L]|nr:hypothetical protein [Aphanocapsa sp. GSE-SYN-MK-11-07L]